jgi:hypothetical protein
LSEKNGCEDCACQWVERIIARTRKKGHPLILLFPRHGVCHFLVHNYNIRDTSGLLNLIHNAPLQWPKYSAMRCDETVTLEKRQREVKSPPFRLKFGSLLISTRWWLYTVITSRPNLHLYLVKQ